MSPGVVSCKLVVLVDLIRFKMYSRHLYISTISMHSSLANAGKSVATVSRHADVDTFVMIPKMLNSAGNARITTEIKCFS